MVSSTSLCNTTEPERGLPKTDEATILEAVTTVNSPVPQQVLWDIKMADLAGSRIIEGLPAPAAQISSESLKQGR